MSVSSRVARASAAILVAITVTALLGGCSWFRKGPRGDYALVQEQRPLEVPPDLTLPDTSGAMALPPAAGGQPGLLGGDPGAPRPQELRQFPEPFFGWPVHECHTRFPEGWENFSQDKRSSYSGIAFILHSG